MYTKKVEITISLILISASYLANISIFQSTTGPFCLWLLLLLQEDEESKQEPVGFTEQLNAEGKRQHDCRIPRIALQDPYKSAFATLFESNNDQALADHSNWLQPQSICCTP